MGPPKVLEAPNPVSSVMMSRTFGASLGAVTVLGKSGLESFALRPITPWKGASGTGSTRTPPAGVLWPGCCAWRLDVNQTELMIKTNATLAEITATAQRATFFGIRNLLLLVAFSDAPYCREMSLEVGQAVVCSDAP